MANEENLMPISEVNSRRSREKHSEDSRKGGIASGKARSANAEMRKRLEQILKMTLHEGKAGKIKTLADAKGANLTISDALLVKLVTMALGGNIKAMNKLMELLDTSNTEAQEAPQSVSSGFVDALNGTAMEVWANEAPEEE